MNELYCRRLPPVARGRTRAREALLQELATAGRESSAATVMFHTAVAERRGLRPTDSKALDVLLRTGPLSHADLGRELGLAPASVTGVIDRLTARGYVERSQHPEDGRRILVTPDEERVYADIAPLFAGWVRELEALYETYSDEELRVIADFLSRAAERQRGATQDLMDA
jgi:DNA-binding MarR family transcriptional regulator